MCKWNISEKIKRLTWKGTCLFVKNGGGFVLSVNNPSVPLGHLPLHKGGIG